MRVDFDILNVISELPEIIQKEWEWLNQFQLYKTSAEVFQDFKSEYNDFQSETINDFILMTDTMYKEWLHWRILNKYYLGFNGKSFKIVWNEFREYWQFDSKETKIIFKEMELLSKVLLQEWRFKYNFDYPDDYEKDSTHYSGIQSNYISKSKSQLWEEFKEIWDIDVLDYDENMLKEISEYVCEISGDDWEYFKKYPRTFSEYRENANYHSFKNYSILRKYDVCKQWEEYRDENMDYESES